jgi:hypothetical protein
MPPGPSTVGSVFASRLRPAKCLVDLAKEIQLGLTIDCTLPDLAINAFSLSGGAGFSGGLMEAGVMEAIATGLAEPDLGRRLALVARTSRRQRESDRGVRRMLGSAAASDADVARMIAGWTADRARSFHHLVEGLEGQLRGEVDGVRAGALIRALSAAEVLRAG